MKFLFYILLVSVYSYECVDNEYAASEELPPIIQSDGMQHFLIDFGQNITKRLSNPNNESGERMIRDMYVYYNALSELLQLLEEKNATVKQKGQTVHQALLQHGGPDHIRVKIDWENFEILSVYKDDSDKEDIQEALKDTLELWDDILIVGAGQKITTWLPIDY